MYHINCFITFILCIQMKIQGFFVILVCEFAY